MANTQMGPVALIFPNSTKAVSDMGGSGAGVSTPLNYTSVTAMRTRLAAANGTYYTSAKLDQMTTNDMIYALRMIDDKTTIADYMPTSTA